MLLVCAVLFAGCSKKDGDSKKSDKSDKKGGDDEGGGGGGGGGGMRKAKKSEGMLMLDKIVRAAKEEFNVNAQFPVATIPLTPATECCADKDHKCQPAAEAWKDWRKLDFQIDEAHLFRYSYESDGKSFTAKAVGDLDCDGTAVTYEARGTSANGNPQVEIVEPPPNSD